ncbi:MULTISPECIES: DNA repair protein RecN [Methylobacterium]|jgi:DNA repair protein RecN (Recombination protein N)|uniref:DNA repair protein RecN n=1 Tax=Methylobacterium aquaticum TaxID=270351 RepID=A0A0C6FKS5_9HYPH|nr:MULTISPECIES: DNA repair protein RecN [Methylobacterium]MBK3395640.1 DNA repair protein RecN [Methylobacterium ajmalii]MBK3407944.1 DNA repair protein RecN [Methylobacterium ajmalii]MBK3426682.1 DNA repair protein RecN [Methylobacterium ajmalii]MBZ6411229.1 DNA repair protein RecN [Methylobacterium sp.]SFE16835.1 DNA replication and repair protein RecN [Methylobacterium sp. yr596]
MLVQLAIRDIVLIDKLELNFREGLSVLTGETGAGKSILLDAFTLALGGRGDGRLVRQGEAQGQVTAVFDVAPDHPARTIAAASDIDTEGDLILRRIQVADGRTRAFVNDQPVGVQVLRAIGAALVEIHGQHDDRALSDSTTHRAILDAFGGLGTRQTAVADAARRVRQARTALSEHRARVEAARKEVDFLRHAVEELAALDPKPGEETELAERRTLMQQGEKVARELNEALDAVGGQGSPTAHLSAALRKLERRAAQAPALVEPSINALDNALVALDEARTCLEDALQAAEFDPRELERVEERLFGLRAAARKYNVAVDDLAALRGRYEGDVAVIDAGEEALGRLEATLAAADAAYLEKAEALSKGRRKAASALDKAVQAELPPLKLERARFITEIATDPEARDPAGLDRVEFWAQTNPGTRPGPMMKVASGGELSRFMLALKVVLADKGSAPTLIFDEIDTGVGGAVADAIGARLARLSARVQTVAVTHAPQVAARASTHFLIAKEAVKGSDRVATRVKPLAAMPRQEEIARMLAGATVTEEARAAAARLLQAAEA